MLTIAAVGLMSQVKSGVTLPTVRASTHTRPSHGSGCSVVGTISSSGQQAGSFLPLTCSTGTSLVPRLWPQLSTRPRIPSSTSSETLQVSLDFNRFRPPRVSKDHYFSLIGSRRELQVGDEGDIPLYGDSCKWGKPRRPHGWVTDDVTKPSRPLLLCLSLFSSRSPGSGRHSTNLSY